MIMESLQRIRDEQREAIRIHTDNSEEREYYGKEEDEERKDRFFSEISPEAPSFLNDLTVLLRDRHIHKLTYKPHLYVYPWVDLQENGELKSLYSGEGMQPMEVIAADIRLLEMEVQALEASGNERTLNCEHVVPQSWFNKIEPMKGDLHHLFACEPSCNSRRSNYPYKDFPDYSPEAAIRTITDGCGKADDGRFEPEYGKGIVARATFYFLIRYPDAINKKQVDLPLLLDWHNRFPVTLYEKHRNQAIEELQGNRNPFIDYPGWADRCLS